MKTLDPILFNRRKTAILAQARRLFATKGFSETSMDDIARASGLQKGSLYHYFTSKQKLLQDLVDGECARWSERLAHFEAGRDVPDTLRRIATSILRDAEDPGRREFFQIVQFESGKNVAIGRALKASPTHNRSGFYAVFDKHLEGRLSRNRIAIFITQFMGALLHYVRLAKLHKENMCFEAIDDNDYVEQLVMIFSTGLRAQLKAIIVGFMLLTSSLSFADPGTAPPSISSMTLGDCYARALHVSETLAIDEQTILQVEAQYRQGLSAVLPSLSWIKTQEFQDTSGGLVNTSNNGVVTVQRSPIPESYFALNQPLFHGLRELNALKGYAAARISSEKNRDQARLSLLNDVAQVFYVSVDLQQEQDLLIHEHQITEDRLVQLQHWVDLGRSRPSEVLSTQVDLVSLEAQMEQTRAALLTARLTLEFLTEIPPAIPLNDDRPDPAPGLLDPLLAQSRQRPDLEALEQDRKGAEFRLKYAQGDYLPTLDFGGKWYTERTGTLQNDRWDALFLLQVPIFQGGSTRAGVQLARSQLAVAHLTYDRQARSILQDVKNAHQTLVQTIRQAALYTKAANLARQNYEAQQKEYRLGLITNLDVLQVLKTSIDLEIQRLRTNATAKVNEINLRVTTGTGL